MSRGLDYEETTTPVVGSFSFDRNEDFKKGFKVLCESMQNYNLDALQNIGTILKNPSTKEAYKQGLIGDLLEESVDDEYFTQHISKLDQMFENSSFEMLKESSAMGQLAPIVGTSLPILKKNYLECVSKDIVLTDVPTKPVYKKTFERKFLKDKEGNKYHIPEIFYDDAYKQVMKKSKGAELPSEFIPDATDTAAGITFPLHNYDLLGKAGGSIAKRDTLALDIEIAAVKVRISEGNEVEVNLQNCVPDIGSNNTFYYKVTAEKDGATVEDYIMGRVDFYTGKVSVSSTNSKIVAVKFGGHLSNENNTNTLELDRERELKVWQIADGTKLNTGLTTEKIKDYKALLDVDIAADTVCDMNDVLVQEKDSNVIGFVRDSYTRWKDKKDLPFGYKGGFTRESIFSCIPPSTTNVQESLWLKSEIKFYLSRLIDKLKIILKEEDIMFVVAGHPNHVTLLDENVSWVIDKNTSMGGVKFNYSFGVLTDSKDRVHVVSSMKIPVEEGLMVIAYPLSEKTLTFKQLDYSMTIENGYRNPNAPLVPNIMGNSRYLTIEMLPVQGRFFIRDNDFGLVKSK